MKRIILLIPFIFLCSVFFVFSVVRADDCNQACFDQLTKQIDDLKRTLQMSIAATNPLEKNLDKLNENLNNIRSRITVIEKEVDNKEKQVKEGEQLLSLAEDLLSQKVRSYYKSSTTFGSYNLFFLLNQNLTSAVRQFGYQKKVIQSDRDTIVKVVLYVKDLEEKKKNLENEKIRLAKIKKETDEQASFLEKVIAGAKKYQTDLSSQIAVLSSRQQDILSQRLSGLNIPRSAASMGRCDSDLTNGRDPGFSPRLAIFTYGVPNRVGLNQWGAYGRARAGQGYDQILHAYYNFDGYQNFDINTKISVDGYGNFSLEDYVKRIYEVPIDWPPEVLKAQAIAARSYALAFTNNGGNSICATESCQVFQPNPKGGAWEQAVNDTAGKIMVQGGKAIKAWFSSTHGGYVFSSSSIGWSSTSWTKNAIDAQNGVGNFSDLQNNSYDHDSPWFYCDWGSRANYNKTAWLKVEELADIVNVLMLVKKDSGVAEHLYQTDKSNPAGTDTWDQEKVKQELRNRGGSPYNNVSGISVNADFGSGKVISVSVSGDGGSNTFDGGEFKNYFNLRAPANIQIVGPLYNVEKR
ncbi:SpoIID/LytB domain-containing protein [Candidatus Gottesmanbacteria bacterium]|nr:SpoIID/LytB domain-containing protein [Candidatus Gottesmanbacteria bacterium]